jgi:hypothetical protein
MGLSGILGYEMALGTDVAALATIVETYPLGPLREGPIPAMIEEPGRVLTEVVPHCPKPLTCKRPR